MAFTRATGKHRRPSRTHRTTVRVASVAALTTTGVVGTLASAPAFAAESAAEQTGLTPVIAIGDSVAEQIDAQAAAQRQAAAEAQAKEEARARAAAQAKAEHEAKERAARAAERKRLNTFVPPITGSYVSTGYKTGGSLWSSGAHTGIDFHASTGTSVHAVGSGTVVEAAGAARTAIKW